MGGGGKWAVNRLSMLNVDGCEMRIVANGGWQDVEIGLPRHEPEKGKRRRSRTQGMSHM